MADLNTKLLHAEPGSSAAPPGYIGNAALAPQNLDPTGKYVLKHQGAFAAVEVAIGPTDGLKSEGGAMVTMSNNVFITTHMEGGLGTSLLRCCCAGSSIFFNHYRLDAGHTRGDVLLAPSVPGEILLLNLDNTLSTSWTIASSNFLACDSSVNIGVRMLGIGQGCCGGEGFFVMEATGLGRLLVNSYGSIAEYRLAPGEVRKIDNGFLVCWSSGMPWTIVKATRSLTDTVLSGEGLVTSFTGPGTVYVQTRSLRNLASALVPYLPSTGGGGGGSSSSN